MSEELKRVMYVEDEPDIQTVAKLALEMVGGFTVEICASGHEALEKVAAFQPQLILLDVMMPGMDGPTMLRKLRELPQFAATPVVFMTAKVQAFEVSEYQESGVAGVIPKPFDPMTLAQQVRKIWDQRRG